MIYLVPAVSAVLYALGGQYNKWFRWAMGIPIALMTNNNILFVFLTYFIATNLFSYGENMWTTKLLGKWASFVLSGFMFGLASVSVLRWELCLLQAFLGAIFFSILKYLDDNEIVKNPFQEFLRGFVGTCVYAI